MDASRNACPIVEVLRKSVWPTFSRSGQNINCQFVRAYRLGTQGRDTNARCNQRKKRDPRLKYKAKERNRLKLSRILFFYSTFCLHLIFMHEAKIVQRYAQSVHSLFSSVSSWRNRREARIPQQPSRLSHAIEKGRSGEITQRLPCVIYRLWILFPRISYGLSNFSISRISLGRRDTNQTAKKKKKKERQNTAR